MNWLKDNQTSSEVAEELKQITRLLLSEIRYLFKAPFYKQENEARMVVILISHDSPQIKEDEETHKLYVEMEKDFSPYEAVLGTEMENQSSVKAWVEFKSGGKIRVRTSKAPWGRP